MSRIILSDAKVLALKPGPRRRFVLDAMVPGLVVQVTTKGHRSYMLRARWPNGRNRVRRLLGEVGTISLDEARNTARQWIALLAQGRDPQLELSERRRQAGAEQAATFAAVCESYFRHLQGRQAARSRKEIAKELLPLWADRPMADITKGDIIRLIDAMRQRNAASTGAYARNVFGHIKLIFQHAALRFDLERSPCDRLRPRDLGFVFRPRERVLSDDEIRAAWRASGTMGFPYGSLVRMLLLTGCRRGEVSDAAWSEFDLDAKIWTIPASRFKAGSEHRVPLTDDMLALLNELPRFQSGDYLFSTTFGKKPVNGFSKCAARLLRLMRAELGADMPNLTLHDGRRTVRTRLSELRIAENVAELCIGHSKRGLLRIYDQHRHTDEIREALEAWNARLMNLVSPPPVDNVVAIRR
jgi:integrase